MKFENSTVKVFGAIALVILVVVGFIVLDNRHGTEPTDDNGGAKTEPSVAVPRAETDVVATAQPAVAAADESARKETGKGSAPRVLGSERSIQQSRQLDG